MSLFLLCKQVHLYHLSRFHMYALIYGICFSLTFTLCGSLQVNPCLCQWHNFVPFYGWVIFYHVYMYHIFFIHVSVDGHLGGFHILVMGNSAAAVNIGPCLSFWIMFVCLFNFLGICPGVGFLGHMATLGFLGKKKKKICLQCRRSHFNFWVRKIHWRRDRLLTPVFLGFHDYWLSR